MIGLVTFRKAIRNIIKRQRHERLATRPNLIDLVGGAITALPVAGDDRNHNAQEQFAVSRTTPQGTPIEVVASAFRRALIGGIVPSRVVRARTLILPRSTRIWHPAPLSNPTQLCRYRHSVEKYFGLVEE